MRVGYRNKSQIIMNIVKLELSKKKEYCEKLWSEGEQQHELEVKTRVK